MSSLAPARPRGRLFARFHCSRSGHEWERQILDSGAEARWVCATCGKLGDEIPVLTPEQEVVEMSETSETSTPVDETVDAEPNASETAEQPDPDVVSAEASDEESASSRLRPAITIVAVAAVSAIVIGGTVLAFRRRRR